MNIAEVILKLEELSSSQFEGEQFAFRLIEAYAPPRATLAKLRQGTLNKATRSDDLLWPKKLHFRPSQTGSVAETLDSLIAEWGDKKSLPRILISTDGQEVVAHDTKLDDALNIAFTAITERYDFFLPLAGVERYQGVPDSPADIKASGRLAKFYDAILEANPDWTAHARVHELNLFLTRILLCMFAQSTGIFPNGLFSQMLHECTSIDGSDTHEVLRVVFDTMDMQNHARSEMPEYATRFPYVNGGLFRDRTPVPRISKLARRILIDAAKLNWSEINPDIFGSMIQAIVKPELRNELGLHYTSVPNIMKALRPLFLDELEGDFLAANDDVKKLKVLLGRLRRIRVFDPACGSGNFLIIAFKELCTLEMKVFGRLKQHDRQFVLPFSEVRFENFTGIEIEDFAVETAKLSLYIAQHQMNVLFKETFAIAPPDLPLRDSGRIIADNATRIVWESVCPPNEQLETYVVGNPPYLGMTNQSPEQKEDVARLFSHVVKGYKELDYVACWFLKAADYCHRTKSKAALVSTNSICQGELVSLLWPHILERGLEIGFAHQSFKWKNNASNNAGVTCVIVSLRPPSSANKYIFAGGLVRAVKHISPYLIEGDDTIIRKRSRPLSAVMGMVKGNQPTDDGNLIFSPDERTSLLADHPEASRFLRRYYGSQEFIKGIERWCLWIEDADLDAARRIPELVRRIDGVRRMRLQSDAPSTVARADTPHRFIQIQDYGREALIVPKVSSEKRLYLPAGFLNAEVIVNDLAFAIYDSSPYLLAILSSKLHLVWLLAASGKLEERLRYSNILVWNTFPIPELSTAQKSDLEDRAWAIIAARERYAGRTIASLYDPETMPPDLLEAHREVDETLERIYNGRLFSNDGERLEHLFKRYKLMIAKKEAPLLLKKRSAKVKVRTDA